MNYCFWRKFLNICLLNIKSALNLSVALLEFILFYTILGIQFTCGRNTIFHIFPLLLHIITTIHIKDFTEAINDWSTYVSLGIGIGESLKFKNGLATSINWSGFLTTGSETERNPKNLTQNIFQNKIIL